MDYVPHTEDDIKKMLEFIGVKSLEELYTVIPQDLILKKPIGIPPAESEPEIMVEMRKIASSNLDISMNRDFRGGGIERHYIPPIVSALTSRGEFLTAYTPYQPEMSQGILQAIFEYQTMICELTGMEVSNASSYDGGTGLGDALIMAKVHKTDSNRTLISAGLNPQYKEVIRTYNLGLELDIVEIPNVQGEIDEARFLDEIKKGANAVIIQTPNFFGIVENPQKVKRIADAIHAVKGLMIISSHPISLAILKTPGEMGADIAAGEGQCLGNMPSFGGPTLGYFAVSGKQLRKLPGRLIGETTDDEGNKAYVMTLQAREQHIRREKATSNICSNQALNALAAAIYMSYYGKEGIRRLARRMASLTRYAIKKFSDIEGISIAHPNKPYFHEFVINVNGDPDELLKKIYQNGFAGGLSLKNVLPEFPRGILVTLKECTGKNDIDELTQMYGDLL